MQFYQDHILTVVLLTPTVGALLMVLIPRQNANAHRWMGNIFGLLGFLVSLPLVWPISETWNTFNPDAPGFQFIEQAQWIPSIGASYKLGIDGISLLLILMTTALGFISILCSWSAIQDRVKEYYILLLLLQTGMLGAFMALDFFLFYVFWEVMLVPMYFLIGVWGSDRRLYAAIKFFLYTLAGSVLMLVAILWLYNLTSSFDFSYIHTLIQSGAVQLAPRTEMLLFLAFFGAFAIKVPLFPLHTWLPDAHVEAPTAGSVILAGVLLKMGTYGILRFCLPLFPNAAREAAPWIALLAIIAVIYGALVAMVQPDFKKLVAYSSVSHMGMVVLGIFAFNVIGIQGAMFQMLAHGVSTGGLFLVAGMLYDRRHTHLISEFGGLATPMPRISAGLLFICLSSLGLPMLNGFVGEFLILAGTFKTSKTWAVFAATGVILSAVYLLWAYQRVVFGKVNNEKNAALPDADQRERLILALVCIIILMMGVASPLFLTRTEVAQHGAQERPAIAGRAYHA